MSAPTITTATTIAAGLVEAMAQAAYESTRRAGSSRPPWANTTPGWRSQARQEMMAGMEAAAKAGWQMVRRG